MVQKTVNLDDVTRKHAPLGADSVMEPLHAAPSPIHINNAYIISQNHFQINPLQLFSEMRCRKAYHSIML
jgi:hypothetical protein